MDSDIVIVVPVLNRPQSVRRLMASVASSTTAPHRLLFVASPGDDAEISELTAAEADFVVIDRPPADGDYARKVNHAYRCSTQSYIFTGADDLAFHPGWDKAALAKMTRPVKVVGTNDLGNERVQRGEHSTHSLVCREYADSCGTIDGSGILYEGYPHEFVDDELIATAKARGAFAFAAEAVVEHLHPFWGKADSDELYAAIPQRMAKGRRLFQQRRRLWENLVPAVPVSVVVATYGDEAWKDLAERAIASVKGQTVPAAEIITVHGDSLAQARNLGARQAKAPWMCFLDADDELHPNFFKAMRRFIEDRAVLNPAVQVVMPGGMAKRPRMFQPKDLAHGNYLVIGTLVRSEVFWEAGGFDPQWEAWEDWAFWRRAVAVSPGGIRSVPQAVYRAFWRSDSRNNTVADKDGLMKRIAADHDAWLTSRQAVHR